MSDGALARLERDYPFIPWRDPIRVETAEDSGYACRVCIALDGLKGGDVKALTHNEPAVSAHVLEAHG